MKTTIEQIKAECRKAIELGEKATPGPWMIIDAESDDPETREECTALCTPKGLLGGDNLNIDTEFISHSRAFSPRAAKLALNEIQALEEEATTSSTTMAMAHLKQFCIQRLQSICGQWEEEK